MISPGRIVVGAAVAASLLLLPLVPVSAKPAAAPAAAKPTAPAVRPAEAAAPPAVDAARPAETPVADLADTAAFLEQARAYVQKGRPESAVDVLDEAIRRWPDGIELRFARSFVLLQLRRYAEATADLDDALRRETVGDTEKNIARILRGSARLSSGDLAGARADLDEAYRFAASSSLTMGRYGGRPFDPLRGLLAVRVVLADAALRGVYADSIAQDLRLDFPELMGSSPAGEATAYLAARLTGRETAATMIVLIGLASVPENDTEHVALRYLVGEAGEAELRERYHSSAGIEMFLPLGVDDLVAARRAVGLVSRADIEGRAESGQFIAAAVQLKNIGRYDAAVSILEEKAPGSETFIWALFGRAIQRANRQDTAGALEDYARLASLSGSKKPWIRMDQALFFEKAGLYESAAATLDEVVRAQGDEEYWRLRRADYHLRRAASDSRTTDRVDAILSEARTALDRDGYGGYSGSHWAVAGFLAARLAGRETEAREILSRAASECPTGAWPYPVVEYFQGLVSEEDLRSEAAGGASSGVSGDSDLARTAVEILRATGGPVAAAREEAAETAAATPVLVPQIGHQRPIEAVAVSPDGRWAASVGGGGLVRVWDIASGRIGRTLWGHRQWVGRVAFSPDGRRLLSAGDDVRLWDLETGRTLRRLIGVSTGPIAFASGGETILIEQNSEIQALDGRTGRLVRKTPLRDAAGWFSNGAFSPDGVRFAGQFHEKNVVMVWDARSGDLIRTVPPPHYDGAPTRGPKIALAPGGRLVALAYERDTEVHLYDVEAGRFLGSLVGHEGPVLALAFRPDGKVLATGGEDQTLRLWDVETSRLLRTFVENADVVRSLAFSGDGRTLVSGSADRYLRVWDTETGRFVRALAGFAGAINAVEFSPDGRSLATGGADFTVRIWDGTTGRLLQAMEGHGSEVNTVDFSPDGRTLVSASEDRTVRFWDAPTGGMIRTVASQGGVAAAYGPDSSFVVSFYGRDRLSVIDAADGRVRRRIGSFGKEPSALAVAPDGRTVASGHWDTYVRLWDARTGRYLRVIAHEDVQVVFAIAFHPGGETIAVGGWSGGGRGDEIRLYSAKTGALLRRLPGHWLGAMSLRFSPDGRLLASGGWDNRIRLWDVASGRLVRTLVGHAATVISLSFSPDGRRLASGGGDATTRIWDVGTGEEIVRLMTFPGGEWAAMTPDNYYASSPRGDEHLVFRVGDALYDVSQYERIFRRPEIVEERLSRAEAGVTGFEASSITGAGETAALPSARPPSLVILDPYQDKDVAEGRLRVVVRAEDDALAVAAVHLVVNGRPAAEGAFTVPAGARAGVPAIATGEVALAGGENVIEAWSENAAGLLSRKERVTVTYRPAAAAAGAPAARPRAFVLSIGLSDYARDDMDLRYARADAEAVVDALRAQAGEGRLFETAQIVFLADAAATSQAVRVALHEFLGRAATEDLVFIFLAGHTVPDRGDHYFLPYDGDMDRPYLAGIPYKELERTFEGLGAQRCVLLIDSCHSGAFGTRGSADGAYQRAVQAFAEGAGMYVISAATGREFALERNDWGHGAFTKALVDGLGGEADGLIGPADGFVTVEEVKLFVSRRVPELTNGRQHPTYPLVRQGQDFPVSLIAR